MLGESGDLLSVLARLVSRRKAAKDLAELSELNDSIASVLEESGLPLFKKSVLMGVLLEKYSSLINDRERRTVGELKSLVNSDDLTVLSLVERFKPKDYVFERDYLGVLEKVIDFFHNSLSAVSLDLDISFWLSPQEVMEGRVGGEEDLSVFLCSVMQALGDKESFVAVAELESFSTKSFVLTSFNERAFLVDPSFRHSLNDFSGSLGEALKSFSSSFRPVKRLLYKFNNRSYEQYI